jgi:hypothetical protein
LCPELYINNFNIVNPAKTTNSVINLFKSGVSFRSEPNEPDLITEYGNFFIDGLTIQGDSDVAGKTNMYYPVYINNANNITYGNKKISNWSIKNLKTIRNASLWGGGSTYDMLFSTSVLEKFIFEPVTNELNASTSTPLSIHNLGVIFANKGNSTVTLPNASDYIGCSFNFRNDVDNNYYIKPSVTDIIEGYSPIAGEGITSKLKGGFLKLTGKSSTSWQVTEIQGNWSVANLKTFRYPISSSSAYPATGTWNKGDIIYNDLTVSTIYTGWICTVAGTPGTWKGFGLIEV